MSEMFPRRVFLRGLGVVAATAALTACSSTNEAVNQALIEGAVGGIVAADCKIGRMTYWAANATVPVYEISFRIVMTNVSSKPVTLSGDNFATTLDGTPIPPFNFSARDVGDADIWRTYDSLLDIRCYMITSVGGSLTQLLQIAWGFSQQRDNPMPAGTSPAAPSPLALPAAISA